MEDFILGLLMVHKLTAYEIHIMIKNQYQAICSYSLGNIQRALKKLHEKGFVILSEVSEGKVVKKIFAITPAGREKFIDWLKSPIAVTKAKNLEIGKLLLFGYLSPKERIERIDLQIIDLKAELEYLEAIEIAIQAQIEALGTTEIEAQIAYAEANREYIDELLDSIEENDILKLSADISRFAILTLKLGMAEAKFNLDWFENLRKELVEELD